jgi:hypothetical protein
MMAFGRSASWVAGVVALCLLPLAVRAQTAKDPADVLRAAVDKLTAAKQSKMRFTYLDQNHTLNFNEKGDVTANEVQVFEVTWIGELQYSRLIESDGVPLAGGALEAEQKRYDKAVKDRAELDDKARAKIQDQKFMDAGVDIASLLTGYRNTVVGRETVAGVECVVVDSTPVSDGLHKHYREWLDEAEGRMMRLRFDQISDEGNMLAGGSGVLVWTFVDGVPLLSEVTLDANVKSGRKHLRVVTHHTYTRFRRFSVSTTILPGDSTEKP